MDICYVPEEHAAQEKLPAVSGSSGRLIVERSRSEGEEPHWPGQVFGEAGLDYAEAMHQYVETTRGRLVRRQVEKSPSPDKPTRWRKEWEGRAERYQVRQQRKQEDLDWKKAKAKWRETRQAFQALTRAGRKEQRATFQAAQQAWQRCREQRRNRLRERKQENLAWHQRNRQLKEGSKATLNPRVWIAVLVVTDNCTRQCLGLPVFRSGPKLTSKEMVSALRSILPEELEFLISDQGTHFRSKALAKLAQESSFIHVPVHRHRPESNGIAERFVLTLKDWLRSKSWNTANGLEELLTEFQPEYNERPHQGLAIPGLSPNEFANRIWLM